MALVIVFVATFDKGSYGWKMPYVFLNLLAMVASLVFVVLAFVGTIGPGINKSNCNKFQRQTGYHTKFIKYNVLSWDCLVEVKKDRWVPKDSIRGITLN